MKTIYLVYRSQKERNNKYDSSEGIFLVFKDEENNQKIISRIYKDQFLPEDYERFDTKINLKDVKILKKYQFKDKTNINFNIIRNDVKIFAKNFLKITPTIVGIIEDDLLHIWK